MNRFSARFQNCLVGFLALLLMFAGYSAAASGQEVKDKQMTEMLVRISEIEIDAADLDKYKAILKEEAAASVRLERGVIAIFPMYQKERRHRLGSSKSTRPGKATNRISKPRIFKDTRARR